MEKKVILVGMEDATKAEMYAFKLANDLRYEDRVEIISLGKYAFSTPHVEVRFIYDIQTQCCAGLRADAVYGFREYRDPLWQFAKPACLRTPRIGLRECIVLTERKCSEVDAYVRNDIMMTVEVTTRRVPDIKNVHFNGPVTAVIWADGTKSVVRCQDDESFVDHEKGLAMAIAKKALGNTGKYYDTFKDHLPAVEETEQPAPATKPVEAAYQLLVAYRDNNMIPDMGTIEEIIGHLGEALA